MDPFTIDRRAVLGVGAALGSLLARRAEAAGPTPPPGDVVALTAAVRTGYAGSPREVANNLLFPGWKQRDVTTTGTTVNGLAASGATINTLVGGSGPPLLLLHGNPETHVAWHKVAATLARSFTVVATDLRGYGDSSKPDGGVDHVDYCKRVMGRDQIEVMRSLGFAKFQAVGHDRGARVLQQMMFDRPDAVTRGVMLDIAPTNGMYDHTTQAFATKYFWWFLQIQDAPFPETLMNQSLKTYLDYHLEVQCKTAGAITGEAYAEYLRCYGDGRTPHGVCEDYRASATIDTVISKQDRGRLITQPILALWGRDGTVNALFDVLKLWREAASDVDGHTVPGGHLIAEEAPDQLLSALQAFLVA